jgi:hypothetical protein
MLTAKNIAEVVALLKIVEHATVKQWEDPHFIGQVRAEAFLVGLPLSLELDAYKIKVEQAQE